ncbi:hypothetical protein KJ969_00460 [Patescibacteria group bacterium]|nr:hypothetical protein [Patescibacteria group bacterium]MBU1922485.1 hypothetical protein [Patescibacteria group bacterium]
MGTEKKLGFFIAIFAAIGVIIGGVIFPWSWKCLLFAPVGAGVAYFAWDYRAVGRAIKRAWRATTRGGWQVWWQRVKPVFWASMAWISLSTSITMGFLLVSFCVVASSEGFVHTLKGSYQFFQPGAAVIFPIISCFIGFMLVWGLVSLRRMEPFDLRGYSDSFRLMAWQGFFLRLGCYFLGSLYTFLKAMCILVAVIVATMYIPSLIIAASCGLAIGAWKFLKWFARFSKLVFRYIHGYERTILATWTGVGIALGLIAFRFFAAAYFGLGLSLGLGAILGGMLGGLLGYADYRFLALPMHWLYAPEPKSK